jgi:hypothetical protein
MYTKQNKIEKILWFLAENSIEIVSYGLAPNPNGFCFELFGEASQNDAKELSSMLDALTSKEELELRRAVFGK